MHDYLDEWEAKVYALSVAATHVCSKCVVDRELWRRVEADTTLGRCDFCGITSDSATFEDLTAGITEALYEFYVTADESGAYHEEGDWSERVEDVQEILIDWLGDAVDSPVVVPLTRFAAAANAVEYGFVRKADIWASLYDHDEAAWRAFMVEARSGDVGKAATDLLTRLNPRTVALLERVTQVAAAKGLFQVTRPSLWRCRAGGQDKNYHSAPDLGTAPAGRASAGRLNAAGHSCFYGSTTERGAILESTKHAGEAPEFWIGQFEPSRPIYHLDVFEVPDPPSPFAIGAADSHDALAFLRRFADSISQPNDTNDEGHYLPTQVFTAFLLAGIEPPEAIRFASSIDSTSENWVVFVDHEHCTDRQSPENSELRLVLVQETARHVSTAEVGSAIKARPS
ncbi:RES domain-containing protein [Nocardioides sp.]|uniref:RES domain-containing protein n=1 Tax=Nocardioides sp. TaxID=35761 RepID=UPI003D13496C